MTPEELLQLINERHGTSFVLGERFAGGEQGAFVIYDPEGNRFALKRQSAARVAPFQHARDVIDLLRARGYPVPRYPYEGTIDGAEYGIQEVLPGVPMGSLEARYIPRLLELNDLQAGLAPLPSRGWRGMLVHSVLEGFAEYCVIATLRDYSAATAEFLARLQEMVRTYADLALPTTDIVHFDFTPSNILVADGQISGVIDWDAPCAGDRAFDLATLLFYATDQPELRTTLMGHYVERSDLAALRLYLAHLIVRQLDWSIRHHDGVIVDHWLRLAGIIADELLDFR
jgi:aminoglycoside phosphotransferase (APT) family kinase protein